MNPVRLGSCPKGSRMDLDKAVSPEATIARVEAALAKSGLDVLAEARRIDNGRLDIPVYMSVCGEAARSCLPARKQMGKGASPAQAKASAMMELMERFAFFSFWERQENFVYATWSQAERLFGEALIPIEQILRSTGESDEAKAREILDLIQWQFYPATSISSGKIVWLPLDWFRMLGEFNGSSAGNANEESILQGVCELVERHVSALAARDRPELPTIDPQSCSHPVVAGLLAKFRANGINIILKDISLGMPLPTIAAVAWDPSTFPDASEIVFTAGTATSPEKAAIRAITEIAQLGGDFNSHACYEASGLPKFTQLPDIDWLLKGPIITLDSLPNCENPDIYQELLTVTKRLSPLQVYAIETTHPRLGIPAHYTIIPGLHFRERDANASIGLFTGRKLAENSPPAEALAGIETLAGLYPDAHYIPFFQGLVALGAGDPNAWTLFARAIPMQPDKESRGLAAFYAGYAKTTLGHWAEALEFLASAVEFAPDMKEYVNLLGVANFKLGHYQTAEDLFDRVLRLDKGSAIDLANRGLCRKFLGKKREAAADLLTALSLEPGLEFARNALLELDAERK